MMSRRLVLWESVAKERRYTLLRSQPFRWAATVLAVGVLSTPAASLAARPAHFAALVSAKQVVLSLSDVTRIFGKGFTRDSAGPLPWQSVAAMIALQRLLHTTAYTTLAQNWIAGYAAEYATNPLSTGGGVSVKSTVNAYKTSGIAQRVAEETFAGRVALTKHAGAGMFDESLTRYSGVGEYAELTTDVMKSARGGKAVLLPGSHQLTLTFTRGHYSASILVVSYTTIRLSAVLAAARIMDSRLHGG